MGQLLQFSRPVKAGDIIRVAGLGYYHLSKVDGYSLHGYRTFGPKIKTHFGPETHIVADYRQTKLKTFDGTEINFPLTHADGVPIRQ